MSFKTLVELIAYRAAQSPQRIAFTFVDEQEGQDVVTYQDLYESARLIASNLLQKLQPGDRALLLYPPGLDLIKAYFACLIAGVVAVPVYPPVRDDFVDKIQHVMDDCKPGLIMANQKTAQAVRRLKLFRLGLKTPLLSGFLKRYSTKIASLSQWEFNRIDWLVTDRLKQLRQASFPCITAENLAFLQYTSGSTGKPKGVEIRHGNCLANLAIIQEAAESDENDIAVFWVPPYHDLGLIAGILSPVYSGVHAYLMSPLTFLRKPFLWLDLISRHKGSLSCAPNFAFDYCRKKITEEEKAKLNLSSLRFCLNGAEPVSSETIEAFYEAFKSCGLRRECISPGYGMAESVLGVSVTLARERYRHKFIDRHALALGQVLVVDEASPSACNLVSCGRAFQEVAIVDPLTFEEKPCGEIGEIWLRGESISTGYWQKEALNQDVFHARMRTDNPQKQADFFRSGDLGFLDEHHDLYITGRIKDLLIIRGRNIYPQDVERAIERCHPMIRRGGSAVFPDRVENQEELIACVEIKNPFDSANLNELLHAVERAIIETAGVLPYCINFIKAGSAFKTTSGKIQRQKTKKAYQQGQLNLLSQDIRKQETKEFQALLEALALASVTERKAILNERIKQIVAAVLFIQNPGRIPEDIDLFDFGIDSIRGLEIWRRLNLLLGSPDRLSKDILFKHNSIHALSGYIQKEILSLYFPPVSDSKASLPQDTEKASATEQPVNSPERLLFEEWPSLVPDADDKDMHLFLTGVTGVLGSYLCKLLLEEEHIQLHCLIRRQNIDDTIEELKALLLTYQADAGVLKKIETHLHFYQGDIAVKQLGLSQDLYAALAARVDGCIHAAANIALQLPYEDLYDVNVFGTKQVIEFCSQMKTPKLLYVSTYSVMGDIQFSAQRPFLENDFDRKQDFDGMGYQRSKFEAERCVRASSGLHWQIVRPGNIFGDSTTGAYPLKKKADSIIFYDIFKTFIETGLAVQSNMLLDITPVDYVAKAMRFLVLNNGYHGQTFHLTNPCQRSLDEIVDLLAAAGYAFERVSPAEYVKRAHSYQIKRSGERYRSLTTSMAMHNAQYICRTEATPADSSQTRQFMEQHGISCAPPDLDLITCLMDYCRQVGYIAN